MKLLEVEGHVPQCPIAGHASATAIGVAGVHWVHVHTQGGENFFLGQIYRGKL